MIVEAADALDHAGVVAVDGVANGWPAESGRDRLRLGLSEFALEELMRL